MYKCGENNGYEIYKDSGDYYAKIKYTNKYYSIKNNFKRVSYRGEDIKTKESLDIMSKNNILTDINNRDLEDIDYEEEIDLKDYIKIYYSKTENGDWECINAIPPIDNAMQEYAEAVSNQIKELNRSIEKHNQWIDENILKVIAEKVVNKEEDKIAKELNDKVDNYIRETYGVLPEKKIFIFNDEEIKVSGVFHKEFENICQLIKANIPILLVGGAGSGKNYTLEQASKALGLDFYFTNAVTQEYKLTGFIDANGNYQETEFYKAFKNGGLFFLDELDASTPESLIILNSAIANKYFDFPTGRIVANENFRVVASANTYGQGADMVYVGRNVLDGATLDRFTIIPFDYDENVEKSQCPDEQLYSFCKTLRDTINKKHLRYIVSIRAMINAYKMTLMNFNKKYIIKTAIIKSMTKDDIESLSNDMNNYSSRYPEWQQAFEQISVEMES